MMGMQRGWRPASHLMVASNEVNGGGVLYLEGQQQADGLQAVGAPINVVPQKQVVNVRDVACCAGGAILLKQPHEVPKLAVQVPENLDGGCTHAG